ncbi:uncharacterized protein LOC119677452 [Teleopsis dalmanni]|uniref:uncharacterized protein LOC119677452 n=1 Tax=Teleopsis dalmanni TaxID=139649 RepID=UPI0018CED374|nr:uncharacterized protein LOC119677452 [Teleopsis dalmanni]
MSSPKSILACLIILALLLTKAESKSVFGIGMRIIGDQILVKDILNSRPAPIDEHPEISFCYAIVEPITYIQIQSDENVLAEVNFSYHNDLVNGTVTAVNATKATAHIPRQFEVLITIYGFNETMLNVNPAYILNKNQEFDGVLEPNIEEDTQYEDDDIDIDGENDYVNANHAAKVNERSLAKKGLEWNENDDDDDDDEGNDDALAEHFEGVNAHNEDEAEFPTDFNSTDKVLELGKRQQGDYLLYDTFQTSKNTTMIPTMHSVVFYYIDSDFITYIKFVVYEHIITESDAVEDTVVAEYSHYTPNSIKALIIDHKSTSLFVQMFVYGFKLIDRPLEYVPYVAYITSIYYRENNEATMSPSQRLRKLMNSFQNTESPTTNTADTPVTPDTNTTFAVELNGLKNVLCMERSELLTGGGATLSASTILLLFSPLGMTLMSTLCSTVISSCTTRI